MTHKCIICHKEFENDDSLKKHVDEHLSESVLSKPQDEYVDIGNPINEENKPINFKKIFSEEKFEKLIESKINQISDVQEIIEKRNFVEQIKKISQKNPFCYPGYFLDDYFAGMSTVDLQEKYHIWFWMDIHNITHNILKLSETRYTSRKYDENEVGVAKSLNLKIVDWKEKYETFQENSEFFKDEINSLFFDNILQAEILFYLMDDESTVEEIIKSCKNLQEHYDLFHFIDSNHFGKNKFLINSFDEILENDLEDRVNEILIRLKKENIIIRSKNDPKKYGVSFSIDKIKTEIIKRLKISKQMKYTLVRNEITTKFPGLRLIPKFGVFEQSLTELEKEKILHTSFPTTSRVEDSVLFYDEFYQKISIDIHNIETEQKKIPFVGRKIDADQFILELLELDKGDFDDADDQVTRVAGLVLAESVKIQSPHEKISDFDFTIDIKNYDFRPEQLEAIGKLNFKINSEILHVKVMVDEKLSFKKYLELKNKIPPNEQGTIITFQALSDQIKNDMKNDATIQIIDEEGVRVWVSITPQIPARVNSISKITFDHLSGLENKIVKIRSVFYETGIAIVNVFPEMNEATVLARTLEEIPLFVEGANNFNESANEYSDFLTVLFTTSNYDDVIDGIFKNKFDHVMKNLFFKFEFDYNVVELNFAHSNKRDIFNCNCIKYAENNLKFCSHLISALDYVFRHTSKQNRLRKILEIWVTENISIILDRLEITKENYNDREISDFIEGKFKILTDL